MLEDQTMCLTAEPSLQPLRGDVLKSRPYPQFSLLQLDEFDAGIYKICLMQKFFCKGVTTHKGQEFTRGKGSSALHVLLREGL